MAEAEAVDGEEVKQAMAVCSIDTEYTACALEFLPQPSPSSKPAHDDRSLVACGTYQLVPDDDARREGGKGEEESSPKMKRVGRCVLYERRADDRFQERQRIQGAGILDLNWSRSHDRALYLADSRGRLHEHRLESADPDSGSRLGEGRSVDLASEDDGVLALSLDISDRRSPDSGPARIVVSLSNGSIVHLPHFRADEDDWTRWKAHDFEPWTCGFDYWQPEVIWTGGDDCKLKTWDLRVGTAAPTSVNKNFDGGVTAIRNHHLRQHLFAVGSYDSRVRLFDARHAQRPVSISQVDVGGGVWRLKWHPSQPRRLLVAAMHDGFKVLDVDVGSLSEDSGGEGGVRAEVRTRYDGHGSLAYGADWAPSVDPDGRTLVGSCSFYDHRLDFWRA